MYDDNEIHEELEWPDDSLLLDTDIPEDIELQLKIDRDKQLRANDNRRTLCWQSHNKERMYAKQREYQERHKEKYKAYAKDYYQRVIKPKREAAKAKEQENNE